MSYEISLYPRRPGQDWEEVLEADDALDPEGDGGDEAQLAEGVETFGRIEARLRELITEPVETWVAQGTGGDVYGEFSVPESGLQVDLYHGSAAVTFEHQERDDEELEAFHQQVRQAVRIVAEETGYQAYDAQTKDSFDETFAEHPDAGAGADAGSAEGATGQGEDGKPELTPRQAMRQRALEARRDPVRMRRRAKFDIAFGLAMVAFATWARNSGSGGLLNTIVLVLGVITLFGGIFVLLNGRRAQQAQQAEQESTASQESSAGDQGSSAGDQEGPTPPSTTP